MITVIQVRGLSRRYRIGRQEFRTELYAPVLC